MIVPQNLLTVSMQNASDSRKRDQMYTPYYRELLKETVHRERVAFESEYSSPRDKRDESGMVARESEKTPTTYKTHKAKN